MSTPETFSKLNTTPSDVGKEPSYGSPTFTQADLIGLLAPAQDEGGNTFPEDYTGIFDSQSRNYQFGIDDNMTIPSASESLFGNAESLQINSTSYALDEHFSNVKNLSTILSRLEIAVQSLSLKVERLVNRIDECEERVAKASQAVTRLEDIFQCVIRREQAAMVKFGDLASRYGTFNENE